MNESLRDETLQVDLALRKAFPFPTKDEKIKDEFITHQGLIG
jgi:hypothetical protein